MRRTSHQPPDALGASSRPSAYTNCTRSNKASPATSATTIQGTIARAGSLLRTQPTKADIQTAVRTASSRRDDRVSCQGSNRIARTQSFARPKPGCLPQSGSTCLGGKEVHWSCQSVAQIQEAGNTGTFYDRASERGI